MRRCTDFLGQFRAHFAISSPLLKHSPPLRTIQEQRSMCLTNYLLVAAAALLVSVSSAADSTSALSTMASLDAVQSIAAADHGKRFLRTTKTPKYDDDDGDGLDSEDEERMFRLNRGDDDLLQLIAKHPGADEQINIWRTAEKSIAQLKNELNQTPQTKKLINLYAAVLARNNHVVRRWE